MKFLIALWMGKLINLLIRIVDKSRGSNLSGEKAVAVDPQMIKKFKGVDCARMLFITVRKSFMRLATSRPFIRAAAPATKRELTTISSMYR